MFSRDQGIKDTPHPKRELHFLPLKFQTHLIGQGMKQQHCLAPSSINLVPFHRNTGQATQSEVIDCAKLSTVPVEDSRRQGKFRGALKSAVFHSHLQPSINFPLLVAAHLQLHLAPSSVLPTESSSLLGRGQGDPGVIPQCSCSAPLPESPLPLFSYSPLLQTLLLLLSVDPSRMFCWTRHFSHNSYRCPL